MLTRSRLFPLVPSFERRFGNSLGRRYHVISFSNSKYPLVIPMFTSFSQNFELTEKSNVHFSENKSQKCSKILQSREH
jgi:hypothetical protein